MRADASLADDLNNFFARFESDSRQEAALPARGEETLTVTELEVRRMFRGVNTRKAAGPDGISGRVLKACAEQLAPVFTTIFNLSLSQSEVERSDSFKYLGVTISQDLSWSLHVNRTVKKARQRLFHL